MVDHEWILTGTPTEFECPPSGRTIRARYENGDSLGIEFWTAPTRDAVVARYSTGRALVNPPMDLAFPATFTEITLEIAGTGISLGTTASSFGGMVVRNSWFMGGQIGISLGSRAE
jgi:hypothetical protein